MWRVKVKFIQCKGNRLNLGYYTEGLMCERNARSRADAPAANCPLFRRVRTPALPTQSIRRECTPCPLHTTPPHSPSPIVPRRSLVMDHRRASAEDVTGEEERAAVEQSAPAALLPRSVAEVADRVALLRGEVATSARPPLRVRRERLP